MSENQTQLNEDENPEATAARVDEAASGEHEADNGNSDAVSVTPSEGDESASARASSNAAGATDEGDIAADYLEELLDIVDLDGDIDIEVRGGRTYVSILTEDGGEELDDLVGTRGEVLDALQELTRLAVLTATGDRTRLVLDIAGHRDQRHAELKELTENAVTKVQDQDEDVHLEPMSAYERKIVHDFVAESGLISESEGEGKRRHVVISPA